MDTIIQTTLANIKLDNCIYNASGCLCTDNIQLDSLNISKSGAILCKSSTINPREGNSALPRSYFSPDSNYSINSMGIPNHGYKYYVDYYLQNNLNKPFIQSLYPFNTTDLVEMFTHINTKITLNKQYLLEINVSCPNVGNNIVLEKIDEYLDIIRNYNINNIPIGLKLMPYYHSYEFDTISNMILKYSNIGYITCINSVINGLDINVEKESTIISPNYGLGGIGGNLCLPVALSNVYQFSKRLNNVDIVGCGGVSKGEDVFKYILVGASAVQIGTRLCAEGYNCFDRISNELIKIMQEHNYQNINQFKGKIKMN